MNQHNPPIYIFCSVKGGNEWTLIEALETERALGLFGVDEGETILIVYGFVQRIAPGKTASDLPINHLFAKGFYSTNSVDYYDVKPTAAMERQTIIPVPGYSFNLTHWRADFYDTAEDALTVHFSQLI